MRPSAEEGSGLHSGGVKAATSVTSLLQRPRKRKGWVNGVGWGGGMEQERKGRQREGELGGFSLFLALPRCESASMNIIKSMQLEEVLMCLSKSHPSGIKKWLAFI